LIAANASLPINWRDLGNLGKFIKFALWGIGTHLTEIRDVAMEELVVKHDPTASEEGFRAGEIGNSPFESPYRAGTAAAWSWHKGFRWRNEAPRLQLWPQHARRQEMTVEGRLDHIERLHAERMELVEIDTTGRIEHGIDLSHTMPSAFMFRDGCPSASTTRIIDQRWSEIRDSWTLPL
jgi:hypothetical protein